MIEDGETDQGTVTTVQRVGDTIRRPPGRWTPLVHALLAHLDAAGFQGAPRVLGFDEDGREVLSLLHGEPGMNPWGPALKGADGLRQLGRWARDYHEAVRGFRPPRDTEWFAPDARWRPGLIVRHGDLGMWNSIWSGDRLAGFIDWDFAEPGEPVDDLAQLAWYAVPLRDAGVQARCGFPDGAPVRERFLGLCEAYGGGIGPDLVLAALDRMQVREAARIREQGGRGRAPWDLMLRRGDAEEIDAEREWLARNKAVLLGG
ncbi:phosphotransferase [Streptomyces sp. NPDC057681]|uniref:phosphotransferase n=1 Tax=Streptomyces sp. NPDC057681 TaxID=3346209 RepID=UPI0036A78D16